MLIERIYYTWVILSYKDTTKWDSPGNFPVAGESSSAGKVIRYPTKSDPKLRRDYEEVGYTLTEAK